MKRLFSLLCLFLLVFSLYSCMWDPYADKRPSDYGNATWSSSDPVVSFTVDTSVEEYYYPLGQIVIDEKEYLCKFWFIHKTNELSIVVYKDQTISSDESIGEINGYCDFSPDSFVMHIDKDTVFAGKYERITFYKKDLPNT